MLALNLQPQAQIAETQTKKLKNLGKSLNDLSKVSDDKLVRAAKEFEGFMLSHMYKTMYNSIEKSDLFGNNFAQEAFMGMFIDEASKQGSLGENGLAAAMIKQYSKGGKQKANLEKLRDTFRNPEMKMTSQIQSVMNKFDHKEVALNTVLKDLTNLVDDLETKLSSDFGHRTHPIHKVKRFHHGMDFALPMGTELHAPSKGKVLFAGKKGGYGNTVILDHGHDITSMYAHLSKINVKNGDVVHKNNFIGEVGSTGLSTGPHLHFEVRHKDRPVDPKSLKLEAIIPNTEKF